MTDLTREQVEDIIMNWLLNDADDAKTESVSQQLEASFIRQIIRAFNLHELFLEINSHVSTQSAIFIVFANIKSLIILECIERASHYLSCCLLYNSLLYALDNLLCLALCLEINRAFKQKLKLELDFTRSYRYVLYLQENLEIAYQYARDLKFEKTVLRLKEKLFEQEVTNSWWIQKGQAWTEELISSAIIVRDCYQFQDQQISKYKQQLDLVALQGKQISQ